MVRELGLHQAKNTKKSLFQCKREFNYHNHHWNYFLLRKTYIYRKGKQRKSSVRRGARKENWPKRAKEAAVAGNRTLHTNCKYGPYTVYIQFRPNIRCIYTVGQNPCTNIRMRIRSEFPYTGTQGWVIRRRRIIRRIVFITYISVFFELLRIIRFWALNEFCSHKPPRAPQKHSQALKSPTEALPSPLEPPRGTPSPSERSMITWWCL